MATSNTFCDELTLDERISFEKKVNTPIHLPFKIEPILPYAMHSQEIKDHVYEMEKAVQKCIPENLFLLDLQSFKQNLSSELPLLIWDKPENAPGCLELSVLCIASKEDATESKIESIIKNWLTPGTTTQVLSAHSLYFFWDLFPDKSFLVMKIKGLIENEKNLSKALSSLPSLSTQLLSGLKNPTALRDFFSNRPLLEELKQTQIHQQLVLLIEKLPHLFNSDLFLEMGRFFSLSSKSFFDPRSSRLITKILAFHYLMKINLLRLISLFPEKRHLEVRYIRTDLNFCFGSKPALGLVLAISPLDNHEFFEESHILQAVQFLLPKTGTVKGSFYTYQGAQDPICTLYVELEKKDGSKFSQQEISLLKRDLEDELKRRIEKLVPSIFMARNEEETMRNILILSQELKYLSDLPQVMISLDSHTTTEIFFTVILLRLVKPKQLPLSKHFESLKSEAQFSPDRIQNIGFLRKNNPKEANVFHLCLPKDPALLRADYSVNFYQARNKISSILVKAIGPFRDYNGGMILKQGELFYQFQDAFPLIAQKNPELLENFFFSLNPIETQATLPLSSLETLFHQFLQAQKTELIQKEHYFLKIEEKKKQLFTMIRTQDSSFKDELNATLTKYQLCSKSLIQNSMHVHGSLYTGIIFPHSDEKKHQAFISIIHEAIKNWTVKTQNLQVLKLSFSELPQSLDPRLSGDDYSTAIIKMLFEGLTRLDKNGKPDLAAAESISISQDRKTYIFKLKKSYWSDGSPLKAFDFEYAWKKILSPDFVTPFAYVFYPIKNAKLAKENLCSIDDLGVKALDNLTLSVELEYPTPEFLELTALSTYSPVHHILDKIHPNWSFQESEEFVCNGPFFLKKITSYMRYELAKNPFYWDKDHVLLQKIILSKDTGLIANEMFKNEEIHWLGQPMRPWESYSKDQPESPVNSASMGIFWCAFNTEKFPFNNKHLRQAFDLAINKQDLISKIHIDGLPASTPLPLSQTMNHNPERVFGNEERALELFEIALKELGLSRSTFPLTTLNFANTLLRENIASYISKKWQKLFKIPCRTEGFHFNTLFAKTIKSDFQVACVHWRSSIENPSHALTVFKYANLDINLSNWSNLEYQKLLELEREELDPVKKVAYLSNAEKVLIEEVPVFSLFYEKDKNKKKSYLHQVIYAKNTGHIDFKYAYIEKQTTLT